MTDEVIKKTYPPLEYWDKGKLVPGKPEPKPKS